MVTYAVIQLIKQLFYHLLWLIGAWLCKMIQIFYVMFRVFSGAEAIQFHDSQDFLLNVFFSNSSVSVLYNGMSLIGIVLLFVFTMLAVGKKIFDLGDKMQQPISEILRKALTSFVFIISMNLIVSGTLSLSNRLLQSIDYMFKYNNELSESNTITFTEPEYAAMARAFDIVGEYSLNPSWTSRYNINCCYNELRQDLLELEQDKVFNYTYAQYVDGEKVESWQSVLAQIARAHDLGSDQPLDEYSDSLSSAITHAMEYVRVNKDNMTVLTEYTVASKYANQTDTRLDVMMFLTGTTDAANNSAYNGVNASFYDPVRKPYIEGTRDMYSLSDVKQDFSIELPEYQHFLILFGAIMLVYEFFCLLLNCAGRIFNMVLLYILAPPFIAAAPFDDGSRFKQWCIAFVIQTFAIFGTIISVRLLILFIPMIFDANLTFFTGENSDMFLGYANTLARMILVVGAAFTAEKASGLLTGILAENAAYQSINASDTATSVRNSTMGKILSGAPGSMLSAGLRSGKKGITGLAGMAKRGYQNHQKHKSQKQNANKLSNDLRGAGGADAARNFMEMDKQSAMDRYGMSNEQYDNTRENLSTRLRHGWDNSPPKTPPVTNNSGNGQQTSAGGTGSAPGPVNNSQIQTNAGQNQQGGTNTAGPQVPGGTEANAVRTPPIINQRNNNQ